MGRTKIDRSCSFKPEFTLFSPKEKKSAGVMPLNNDEMESIFLMDYQSLYQEDAAKAMNVSRPTFSRILKSARKKITTALVCGYEIQILDKKDRFIIAIPTDEEDDFSNISLQSRLIALAHLQNQKVQSIIYVENPLFENNVAKPSMILPHFLKENGVNYLLGSSVGEGLKNSLLAQGIFFKSLASIKNIQTIPKMFC